MANSSHCWTCWRKGPGGYYKARLDHQVDLCSTQHLCVAGRKVSVMAPCAHCSLALELGQGLGEGVLVFHY